MGGDSLMGHRLFGRKRLGLKLPGQDCTIKGVICAASGPWGGKGDYYIEYR